MAKKISFLFSMALLCIMINHLCAPNVIVKYKCRNYGVGANGYLNGLYAELYALEDIEVGEELLQSYIDQFLRKLHLNCVIKVLSIKILNLL